MVPKRTASPSKPAKPVSPDILACEANRMNTEAGFVNQRQPSVELPLDWPASSVKPLAPRRRFRFGWSSSRARKTPASAFDPVATRAFEHHWQAMNRLLGRHISWVTSPETPVTLRMGLNPGQVIASPEAHDVDMAMQHFMALQSITRKRKAKWLLASSPACSFPALVTTQHPVFACVL